MEQARRPALAHHVHRIVPMGARVLINETRYELSLKRNREPVPQRCLLLSATLRTLVPFNTGGCARLFV
jgi:hypothetical protein